MSILESTGSMFMIRKPEDEIEPDAGIPYDPTFADQAFIDARELGGKHEISLREIDPRLWLKGIIGEETGRYPGEISDDELERWLRGDGGWRP